MGNSYQNFKERLYKTNEYARSSEFTRYSGKVLYFHVKSNKINELIPIFWKFTGSIRISVYEMGEESDPGRKLKTKLSINEMNRICEILMQMKSISSLIPTTMMKENECSICLERIADTILPCQHSFCGKDIFEWQKRNNTCPFCRNKIKLKDSFTDMTETQESIQFEIDVCLSEIISMIS